MFHDYGGGHTRMSGDLLLGPVTVDGTANGNNQSGNKLRFVGVNPIMLGGRIAQESKGFEQCKMNYARLVFVPCKPDTTTGSVALWYTNEEDLVMFSTGTNENVASAERQAFQAFSVFEHASVEVSPSDANLKYADSLTGSWAADIQGTVGISLFEATNDVAVAVLGDWFLKYDYEFYSPQLDYTVVTTNEFTLTATMAATTSTYITANKVVQFYYQGGGAIPSFTLNQLPITTGLILEMAIMNLTQGANFNQSGWTTFANKGQNSEFFAVGQGFFGRLAGPASWVPQNNFLTLYGDIASAAGTVMTALGDAADGQLTYVANAAAPVTMTIVFWCRIAQVG